MSQLQEYKCPCCGGALAFDGTIQKMKCPFCDSEFDVDTLAAYDSALNNVPVDDMQWDTAGGADWEEGEDAGLRSYVCNSCGGEIIGDENTAGTTCPYCGNPVVMMEQFTGMLKPQYIVPFVLDKKAAKASLARHLEGKKLLPNLFKTENHIDEIKGLYVPFWLFDAVADADIRYEATQVREWSSGDYDYKETSYYMVKRAGTLGFANVAVDGSSKMPNDLMESLEPYSYAQMTDFKTPYLAGYLTDKYDVKAEDCVERANERIRRSTLQTFARTVMGYDSVNTESAAVRLNNAKAKYALMPVWILNTTWQDQKFTFAMNGQTGRFVGNLPVDKGKAFRYNMLYFFIGAAISYLLCWILSWLGVVFEDGPGVWGVVISLAIGLIVSLSAVGIMRAQMKSVDFRSEANDYIIENSLNLSVKDDVYLYKKTERTERSN